MNQNIVFLGSYKNLIDLAVKIEPKIFTAKSIIKELGARIGKDNKPTFNLFSDLLPYLAKRMGISTLEFIDSDESKSLSDIKFITLGSIKTNNFYIKNTPSTLILFEDYPQIIMSEKISLFFKTILPLGIKKICLNQYSKLSIKKDFSIDFHNIINIGHSDEVLENLNIEMESNYGLPTAKLDFSDYYVEPNELSNFVKQRISFNLISHKHKLSLMNKNELNSLAALTIFQAKYGFLNNQKKEMLNSIEFEIEFYDLNFLKQNGLL